MTQFKYSSTHPGDTGEVRSQWGKREAAGFVLSYLLGGWKGGLVSFCKEKLDLSCGV